MWRLEHPEFLYALALLPALWAGYALANRAKRRALKALGDPGLLQSMMRGYSATRERARMALFLSAVALLILGLANPQLGTKSETALQRSLDVILALDISQSMLAQDVPPNRLERARQFARELALALRSERVGLVLLAGSAYPQMPLSSDFAALDMGLRSAHPGLAPNPGTAVGDAVEVAEKLFGPESNAGKVLILISDGETHDTDALARAQAAGKNKVVIFTIGVGTPEGGFIPLRIAEREDYKRDETGEPVRSRLNEEFLRQVADAGKGRFFRLDGQNEKAHIQAIRSHIDTLEKQELELRQYDRYRSFFQVFLALGLVLLLAKRD
jgi:Ca-activated chloride channel homolog